MKRFEGLALTVSVFVFSVVISTLLVVKSCEKEKTPTPITIDTTKEDSLRAQIQVRDIQIKEDSLIIKRLRGELIRSLDALIERKPLTKSVVDSLINIRKNEK